MSVIPYQEQSGQFVAEWLKDPAEVARVVGGTEFVPQSLRHNLPAITAALLYGAEVGLGPMQSLAKIAVINGRPTLAAEAQRALILAAGHELWIEESTTTRCTVGGRRRGSDEVSRMTWTLDDAKRAGIAGKEPWRKYPRQMLLARATAELARAIFADAIGGLAATEEAEVEAEVVEDGVEPTTTTRRRRRVTVSQPQTSTTDAPAIMGAEPPLPGDVEMPPAEAAGEAAPDAEGVALDDPHSPEDAPGAVEGITDAQLQKLQILFRERGFSGRAHRLAWATVNVHRHIESSKDLTKTEASHLIDLLEQSAPSTLDDDEL